MGRLRPGPPACGRPMSRQSATAEPAVALKVGEFSCFCLYNDRLPSEYPRGDREEPAPLLAERGRSTSFLGFLDRGRSTSFLGYEDDDHISLTMDTYSISLVKVLLLITTTTTTTTTATSATTTTTTNNNNDNTYD